MDCEAEMDSQARIDIEARISEFLLRREKNPRVSAKKLLYKVSIGDDYASLRNLSILRDLRNDVMNGTVDERTLDQLESMEKLLLEESRTILKSLTSAYCWVAVDCTVRYILAMDVKEGKYLDALERIWDERIGRLKERKSKLVSPELIKWEDDLSGAVADPGLCERIRETNTRYVALLLLNEFVSEQFTVMEAPSLEIDVEKVFRNKRRKMQQKEISQGDQNGESHRERPGGDDEVVHLGYDSCDGRNEQRDKNDEEIGDNEAVVHEHDEQMGDKKTVDGEKSKDERAAEELEECLLEMYELVNNPGLRASKANDSNKASNPSNTDPSISERFQGRNNNVEKNMNEGACGTEGTSSDRVGAHLQNPRSLDASPLRRTQPQIPQSTPHKEKKGWTIEEERALREGVNRFGRSWKAIKKAYPDVLALRTEVNLKDKWRNLVGG